MTSSDARHLPTAPAVTADSAPVTPVSDSPDLRRLINSVIWPGFIGTTVPEWLDGALRNGLAGVVYFSHNIDPDAPGQIKALSEQIRQANPAAVIGVDEEGGNVTRLQARDGSTVPGAAVLGALDDLAVTTAAGRAIGRLCHEAGVNVTIAPVADVNTNPLNPVIGVRAFGADTELVSRHTAAAVAGIQEFRVGACAKHFPGHGDTISDSHMELARVDLSMDQMRQFHLPPFAAAVDAGVAAVMSAHIIIPELGEEPATLNPKAAQLLRDMGFTGVLITDALDMAAIRATVGPGEGAVLALLSGNDLLCVGNPLNAYTTGRDDEDCYREVFNALLTATTSGRLPVARLQEAAGRVLALSEWTQGSPAPLSAGQLDETTIDWVDVAARACSVSKATIAGADSASYPTLGDGDGVLTLVDSRTGHNMAAGPTENFLATALMDYCRVNLMGADTAELQDLLEIEESVGDPILVLVDSLADPAQLAALENIASAAPHGICINVGLKAVHEDPSKCRLSTVNAYGFSRVSAEAIVQLLR